MLTSDSERAESAPALSRSHVDRAMVAGLAWTALGKWTTQVATWVSTMLVARLLLPSDYGIVGMAMTFIGIVQMVGEFGLGSAIVQNRRLTSDQIARLYGLILIVGLTAIAICFVAAEPVALFFKTPAVANAVRLLSLLFLFSAVQMVPRSLLHRDLHFRTLAAVDAIQSVSGAACTLLCAWYGLGFWALVFGNVLGSAAATVFLVLWRKHPLRLSTQLADIRDALRFGGHMTMANLGWYVYSNADTVVIGRILGSAAAGVYSLSGAIASAPINQITSLVGRVAGGVFSATQHDLPALRRYIGSMLEVTGFAVFPMALGLAVVAPEAVAVVIGQRWSDTVMPIQFLAAAATLRCTTPILVNALIYCGNADANARITLAGTIVYPLLFLLGVRWGPAGVAAMWFLGVALISIPMALYYSTRRLGFSPALYLQSVQRPALAVMLMVALLMVMRWQIPLPTQALPRLVVLTLCGALTYALILRLAFWRRVQALRSFIRDARAH